MNADFATISSFELSSYLGQDNMSVSLSVACFHFSDITKCRFKNRQ